jgi:hypothetical protein
VAPWGLAALVLALVAGQARTRVAISAIKVAKLRTGSASSGNFDAALSCAEAE